MANKQRDPRPAVMSTEETRVRPPEEDEEPPEDAPSWEGQGVDEATPPFPRKLPVSPPEELDDATRPIPRKTGARPALKDDATRPIPRKTGARPALQDPDDATRPIPRKTGARPALQDPDDATRHIPRKTGTRPALKDSDEVTRAPPRKTGARRALDASSLPWDAQPDDADPLAPPPEAIQPITDVSHVSTAPLPVIPPVLTAAAPPPRFASSGPPAPLPLSTLPSYAPDSPPVLTPVVTTSYPVTASMPTAVSEPPPNEELRTAFSNKAALIADLVRATFARRSYGSAPYRLRIDEPDGPSTAGGLLARQPISLVSNLESAPAIVCGWVDVSKKESQLRSYAAVVKRHQSRHGAELDITAEEYERFLNELVDTLFYGGIKVLVLIPDEQEATPAQAQAQVQAQQRASRSPLLTFLLVVLAFALGLGAGVMNAESLAPMLEQLQGGAPQR